MASHGARIATLEEATRAVGEARRRERIRGACAGGAALAAALAARLIVLPTGDDGPVSVGPLLAFLVGGPVLVVGAAAVARLHSRRADADRVSDAKKTICRASVTAHASVAYEVKALAPRRPADPRTQFERTEVISAATRAESKSSDLRPDEFAGLAINA